IDRKHAEIPLGFYLPDDAFDPDKQKVKGTYANSDLFNLEFDAAKGKAAEIAGKYRLGGRVLTPHLFREEYTNPVNKDDFIQFYKAELELRKPKLAVATARQHQAVLN